MDGDGPTDPVLDQNAEFPFGLAITAVNSKEGYRLLDNRPDVYLINLKDGSRKCIRRRLDMGGAKFSPGGRYLWWYDRVGHNFFTYDISNGKLANVSRAVGRILYDEEWDRADFPSSYGLGNWLQEDKGMFVYDRYDIWRLDPTGVLPPTNMTYGYGRKHKIKMRLVSFNGHFSQTPPPIRLGDSLVVAGLDEVTKSGNGFLR